MNQQTRVFNKGDNRQLKFRHDYLVGLTFLIGFGAPFIALMFIDAHGSNLPMAVMSGGTGIAGVGLAIWLCSYKTVFTYRAGMLSGPGFSVRLNGSEEICSKRIPPAGWSMTITEVIGLCVSNGVEREAVWFPPRWSERFLGGREYGPTLTEDVTAAKRRFLSDILISLGSGNAASQGLMTLPRKRFKNLQWRLGQTSGSENAGDGRSGYRNHSKIVLERLKEGQVLRRRTVQLEAPIETVEVHRVPKRHPGTTRYEVRIIGGVETCLETNLLLDEAYQLAAELKGAVSRET